jgi:hypothetical protein
LQNGCRTVPAFAATAAVVVLLQLLQLLQRYCSTVLLNRVGRGAGAPGARGAKKWRPGWGRGALQKFRGRYFEKEDFSQLVVEGIEHQFVAFITVESTAFQMILFSSKFVQNIFI